MNELTNRQKEVLDFLKKIIADKKYPPTVREIGEALGLNSPATVHSHLGKLEEKGYIKKSGSKNRSIELLVNNEYDIPYEENNEQVVSVPLLGVVTAGSPIEAIEQPDEFFSLPAHLVPSKSEVFALTVSGESMINVGIYDGDTVLVERQSNARNGDIVVAMTEDDEVTLKTYYKESNHIRLQPENDYLEPIILANCTILGKAIGLYRTF